jgi:hypothetical protein
VPVFKVVLKFGNLSKYVLLKQKLKKRNILLRYLPSPKPGAAPKNSSRGSHDNSNR